MAKLLVQALVLHPYRAGFTRELFPPLVSKCNAAGVARSAYHSRKTRHPALSREVSMSRVFENKPKTRMKSRATQEERKAEIEKPNTRHDSGMTLVQATPMKHHYSAPEEQAGWYNWCQRTDGHFAVPSPPPTSSSDPGDAYIEDTPVAPRTRRNNSQTGGSPSPLPR